MSSFYLELFRAMAMPAVGIVMLFLGGKISALTARWRNGLSVAAVALAVIAMAAHYYPYRSVLGPSAERIGGEGAVAGYALLLLVGVGRAKMRSALLTIGMGVALAVILVFALSPIYWHFFGHALHSNYPDRNGCIRQTTAITCIPASASMLLERYGFRISEGLLAERAGTNPLVGTNEFSLARAMQGLIGTQGLRAHAGHLDYEQAWSLHRPFVAYLVLPCIGGHAVLVTSLDSGKASIHDPLTGSTEETDISEFRETWSGTAVWIAEPSTRPTSVLEETEQ